jgi:hypothetical protein
MKWLRRLWVWWHEPTASQKRFERYCQDTIFGTPLDPFAGYADMPRWLIQKPTADRLPPLARGFSRN